MEFCDDGHTDACGTCNIDCTGAGAGSVCGDGVTCAETESCDDAETNACGVCNADCTDAGTGVACKDGSTAERAGESCAQILAEFALDTDGVYWLDPDMDGDTSNAFQTHCDMATEGGGWALIVRTTSYRQDYGQTTPAIVTSFAADTAPAGVFPAFGGVTEFSQFMLLKTAGNNNVGDYAVYDLVTAVSGRSLLDILVEDCRPAACVSSNDTVRDGPRVEGGWTSEYSGLRTAGALQMRSPSNLTVTPEYMFVCGVSESSDNDQSVLAFTDRPGDSNSWGDSWRGNHQHGALWSFWNNDYYACPRTAHIGNGAAEGYAGWKGLGRSWESFHTGDYEVYLR